MLSKIVINVNMMRIDAALGNITGIAKKIYLSY